MKDLQLMHFDGINGRFLHGGWASGGCLNTISTRFGYRIVLKNAQLPDAVRPGNYFNGHINLKNIGWGKIYNPRNFEFVFKNTISKAKIIVKLDIDPRRWCMTEGEVNVPFSAPLPENIPEGAYQVFLNLPDPYPKLHDRKEYSIQLANKNIWEDSTGYNSLQHKVSISLTAPPSVAGIIRHETIDLNGLLPVRVQVTGKFLDFIMTQPVTSPITLEVFTLSGTRVWNRLITPQNSSAHTERWTSAASGLYLWKVSRKEKDSRKTSSRVGQFLGAP
jgi:hypothetical protein